MRFFILAAIVCFSSISTITGSLIPYESRSEPMLVTSSDIEVRGIDPDLVEEVGKQVGRHVATAIVSSAIAGAIGGGNPIITAAAKLAVKVAIGILQNIADWDEARQKFTQEVTLQMWAENPSPDTIVATVCYNKGYDVSNTDKIVGLMDVDFKLGPLNTDYDCMYLEGPVQFWTRAEGGYQNLCYRKGDSCSYDDRTGDLNCAAFGEPAPGNGD